MKFTQRTSIVGAPLRGMSVVAYVCATDATDFLISLQCSGEQLRKAVNKYRDIDIPRYS
nr:hypothetical protein [Paraburkholderia sp. BL8N3]